MSRNFEIIVLCRDSGVLFPKGEPISMSRGFMCLACVRRLWSLSKSDGVGKRDLVLSGPLRNGVGCVVRENWCIRICRSSFWDLSLPLCRCRFIQGIKSICSRNGDIFFAFFPFLLKEGW